MTHHGDCAADPEMPVVEDRRRGSAFAYSLDAPGAGERGCLREDGTPTDRASQGHIGNFFDGVEWVAPAPKHARKRDQSRARGNCQAAADLIRAAKAARDTAGRRP